MTQTALASKAGVSRQTLHRAIHQDELTSRVAKQIAAVVGIDLLNMADGTLPIATPLGRSPSRLSEPLQQSRHAPIGDVLEILRVDEGITQEQMASLAEISVSTYRRVLTGEIKAKAEWLRSWAEQLDFEDSEPMLRLRSFPGPTDEFHRAVGRQLHAWRVSRGYRLIDVADAIGTNTAAIARFEAGDDEGFLTLDELAPLYGTSSDVIYRAAVLSIPPEDEHPHRPAVERVLTFEAAQAAAYDQQKHRDKQRLHASWDLEPAFELSNVRNRAGFSLEDVAAQIERPVKLIELWEEGDREPSLEDFERMAVLYRTTPWALCYGSTWSRAYEFPNAPESRALIFASVLPAAARTWLYRFLAEFAEFGLDEVELTSVRESLTLPDKYYDVQFVYTEDEAVLFLRAKLRLEAEELWRNVTDPGWVDRTTDESPELPSILTSPGFDTAQGDLLIRELQQRRIESYARETRKDGNQSPAFLADPFSYFTQEKTAR